MPKIKSYSLYLVISQKWGLGRSAWEIAKLAISAGVDIIQMREKTMARGELVTLGGKLAKLCREKQVRFIVNDDPRIARECNADGVHLGQVDLRAWGIAEAREIVGRNKIIGVSTHSLSELKEANAQRNIDYIAYGPVFPTKTKNYFLGTEDIKEVLNIASKPVFFIGGINLANLDKLLEKGAKNIALIRDIIQAEDIAQRAKSFKDRLINKKLEKKMMVKINGRDEFFAQKINLAELVAAKTLGPERIVVEHNLRIVPREDWENIFLNEFDQVELLNFVGGGQKWKTR